MLRWLALNVFNRTNGREYCPQDIGSDWVDAVVHTDCNRFSSGLNILLLLLGLLLLLRGLELTHLGVLLLLRLLLLLILLLMGASVELLVLLRGRSTASFKFEVQHCPVYGQRAVSIAQMLRVLRLLEPDSGLHLVGIHLHIRQGAIRQQGGPDILLVNPLMDSFEYHNGHLEWIDYSQGGNTRGDFS